LLPVGTENSLSFLLMIGAGRISCNGGCQDSCAIFHLHSDFARCIYEGLEGKSTNRYLPRPWIFC
jgi:hypothetical protein